MPINKKQVVVIVAVVLTVVCSLRRWRGNSSQVNDYEFDTEQDSPTTD